jgi:uncharacterized DUF497 family protein
MRIHHVQWPRGIKEKVESKHGLDPEQVQSAIFDRRAWIKRAGPERYILLGQSEVGVYVTVFFGYNRGIARIMTARPMDRRERRIYQRRGK